VKVYDDSIKESFDKAVEQQKKALEKATAMKKALDDLEKAEPGTSVFTIVTKKDCETVVKRQKIILEQKEDAEGKLKKMLAVIAKAKGEALADINKKTTGTFGYFYKYRKTLVAEFTAVAAAAKPPGKVDDAAFKLFLTAKTTQLKLDSADFKANIVSLKALKDELPDCSAIDGKITADQKVGLAAKAWAGIKALNFASDKCLAGNGAGSVLVELATKGVEKVVEIILDIFTGFAVTLLKAAYYFAKALFYVFKAAKLAETTIEKALYTGKAVDCAIRVLLVFLKVGKKRKAAMKKAMKKVRRIRKL